MTSSLQQNVNEKINTAVLYQLNTHYLTSHIAIGEPNDRDLRPEDGIANLSWRVMPKNMQMYFHCPLAIFFIATVPVVAPKVVFVRGGK